MKTTTIHVLKPFVLVLAAGERVPYAAGTHRNVPVDHADHWFTKLHCGEPEDLPVTVVDPGEFAALRKQLEAIQGAVAERDIAVSERDAAKAELTKAAAELETAKAEIARLNGELEAAHALIAEAGASQSGEQNANETPPASDAADKAKGKKAAA